MRLLIGLGLSVYLAAGVLTQVSAVLPEDDSLVGLICLAPMAVFIGSLWLVFYRTTRHSEMIARAALVSIVLWLTFIPAGIIINHRMWEPLTTSGPVVGLALAGGVAEIGIVMALISAVVYLIARHKSRRPILTT